jgi:hypothetical protein
MRTLSDRDCWGMGDHRPRGFVRLWDRHRQVAGTQVINFDRELRLALLTLGLRCFLVLAAVASGSQSWRFVRLILA